MDHEEIKINLAEFIGYKSNFFIINLNSIKYSLIASALLILICLILRFFISKIEKGNINSKSFFIFYYFGSSFRNFIKETIGFSNKNIFNFTISIFFVLIFYNLLVLIPGMEEPTKDINVTIALALYVIFSINYIAYKINKKEYISHWITTPIKINTKVDENIIIKIIKNIFSLALNSIIALLLFPFHILDKFSLCLSLSFRLFGNIFGGSMVAGLANSFFNKSIINHIFGSLFFFNIIVLGFFGFFEGLIQAFVFTLISLNNIGIMIEGHLTDEDKRIMELKDV